jgi:hypothetical protein
MIKTLVVQVTVSEDGDCYPCEHLKSELDGHWCRLFGERLPGMYYDTPTPCSACRAAEITQSLRLLGTPKND